MSPTVTQKAAMDAGFSEASPWSDISSIYIASRAARRVGTVQVRSVLRPGKAGS